MATAATTSSPPPTAENHCGQSQSGSIEQESQHSNPATADQPIQNEQNTQLSQSEQQCPTLPSASTSLPVIELRNLSSALSTFQSCFNDLQQLLNTLKTAVDSLIITVPPQENYSVAVSSPKILLQQSSPVVINNNSPIEEKNDEKDTKFEENLTKHSDSELETLCRTMSSKGLKKYLVSNLSEMNKLKEEVPKALKHASCPSRLVLECAGRFYLQGSRAYTTKGSAMVLGREASVLVLECFLLMKGEGNGNVAIGKEVKEEADNAALAWKRRMCNEGGLANACEIDARGLLLLVGCYGMPQRFKNDDLRDLLRACNAREISSSLRKSTVLMEKVPEIIQGMIKNKMEVDAVDLAYTFGFEERFNALTILRSFLNKAKDMAKNTKKAGSSSPAALNLSKKKKLSAFKSVLKCLESHEIEPSKLLPEWKVSEKIATLEESVSEFEKENGVETTQKRKANEPEPAKNLRPREGKRSRFNSQGLPKPKAVGHVDSQRHLIDGSIPGHINSYSASPSLVYAQATAAGGSHYGRVYAGMMVDAAGHMTNHGIQTYGWRGDPGLTERVVSQSYTHLPSSSSINGLYGPSSSLEGYGFAPSASSVGVSSRTASDLYQFADTVVGNEYQPPVIPTHHSSSYLP